MAELMVDIDEVICPTIDSIHDLARKAGLHNGDVDPQWAGWKAYGCSEEVYWDLWTQFATSGGYVSTPPIESAAAALRWLHWEGHKIHLVTARGFMAHADDIRLWTPQWLEEWAIPHDTLTFAQDKVAAQEIVGVQWDFAIDDSPSNYAKLDAAGVAVYLLNHAHNKAAEVERRVPHLWEWAYIIERSKSLV